MREASGRLACQQVKGSGKRGKGGTRARHVCSIALEAARPSVWLKVTLITATAFSLFRSWKAPAPLRKQTLPLPPTLRFQPPPAHVTPGDPRKSSTTPLNCTLLSLFTDSWQEGPGHDTSHSLCHRSLSPFYRRLLSHPSKHLYAPRKFVKESTNTRFSSTTGFTTISSFLQLLKRTFATTGLHTT